AQSDEGVQIGIEALHRVETLLEQVHARQLAAPNRRSGFRDRHSRSSGPSSKTSAESVLGGRRSSSESSVVRSSSTIGRIRLRDSSERGGRAIRGIVFNDSE